MKKVMTIICVAMSLSACVSSSPPICYNEAVIYKQKYDIAVFKVEDGKYLAGKPFYTWTDNPSLPTRQHAIDYTPSACL